MRRAGLYVHIPFCARRCDYCDFATAVRDEATRERTVAAILREGEIRASEVGGPVETLYLGGGTPSHLGAELLAHLLDGLRRSVPVQSGGETTLEANPESVDGAVLGAARAGGINRLSIGVQSFDDASLRRLGRLHDAESARAAVGAARRAGFENCSVDLIYGIPEGGESSWRASLAEAIDLGCEHVSCYLLTPESHVPLGQRIAAGKTRLPGDGQARLEYDLARGMLRDAGYRHYEVSNWARPGFECRHNESIWRRGEYLGLGPGAHGHLGGIRRANAPDLEAYIEALEAGRTPPGEETALDRRMQIEERLFLGLRTREGVRWENLREEAEPEALGRIEREARRLASRGFVEYDGASLRIAVEGLFVSNRLIAELIAAL